MLEKGNLFHERYEILSLIGSGGMSTVYLALDTVTNMQVAIKEFEKHDTDNRAAQISKATLSEANFLRKLSHTAIPSIFDVIEDNERICIVMEYLSGKTLDQVVSEDGPQPEALVSNWAAQLALVLGYLHDYGLLYLDMKPSNIMLQPDGKLKLIDFGTARMVRTGDPEDTAVLGTRNYASPEHFSGYLDARSDIYSLGMTLYHLLTGVIPRGETLQPIRLLRPELSVRMVTIIEKCIQPAPEKRYQSCGELLTALRDAPASHSVPPPPPAPPKKRNTGKPKWNRLLDLFKFKTSGSQAQQSSKQDPDQRSASEESLNRLDRIVGALFSGTDGGLHQISACTERTALGLGRIVWSQVRHLNIIGDTGEKANQCLHTADLRPGAYVNSNSTWLLLVKPNESAIQKSLLRCSDHLKVLQIGNTRVDQLSLSHLNQLTTLNLRNNDQLTQIQGIHQLTKLADLRLESTAVEGELDLNNCTQLKELCFADTRISRILLNHPLHNLERVSVTSSPLEDAEFLRYLPNLRFLVLNKCPVRALPPLTCVPRLINLEICETQISTLTGLEVLHELMTLNCTGASVQFPAATIFPDGLKYLFLSSTPLRQIPDGIRNLKELSMLGLNDLKLDDLPDWLPEIAAEFDVGQAATRILGWHGAVVLLENTTVTGVDMSIFSRPYPMVIKWFEDRAARQSGSIPEESENSEAEAAGPEEQQTPLNEIKVVFLGDGEAGKSLTVARLLRDGGSPEHFDGEATPGIAIADRTYNLDGRQVQVHFWDFGGQEILHSMHRMFLTDRTLYVIVLNSRDDTQDDRARYWLHNVKSFTKGAPVLLVLNKIDQNPNASINESGLKKAYPGLKEVVRMSALKFSPEEFNSTFAAALKRQIAAFDDLESPFLPAWRKLKDKLTNMTDHYILSPDFASYCQECGVEPDDRTRRALLKWFMDLGVSFFYGGSAKLEDYVILRPSWITNAIYILLYNPIAGNKNGIVSHEDIFRMLNPPEHMRDQIKRVLPDVFYSTKDTEYVLNVVRRFRLSYRVEDEAEFFPMLCDRNETDIVRQYASEGKTLEFRMIYEYLPNNVIHRLMVDMHRDLDMSNVWLTGAHFRHKTTGLSAVVKSDGNTLVIYASGTNSQHPAVFYLDILKDVLEQINSTMGLRIEQNQVVYKDGGISEAFDYDDLVGTLSSGGSTIYSKLRKRMIPIRNILQQSDHQLDNDRDQLIRDILNTCRNMQANKLYWDVLENDRNTYIRDALQNMRYIAMDQSLAGISAGGKLAGELDLDIRKTPNVTLTIFEGLNLSGTSDSQKAYWNDHLKKLLDNYNAIGLPFLITASYVPCRKSRFLEVYNAYAEHIKYYSPSGYSVQHMSHEPTASSSTGETQFLRMMKCIYDCGGAQTTVYHIFLRLGDETA